MKNKNLWFKANWEFDHFLTFYYVEKRNGILRKNRGEGFEKSYISLHGGRRGGKKCPKSCLSN